MTPAWLALTQRRTALSRDGLRVDGRQVAAVAGQGLRRAAADVAAALLRRQGHPAAAQVRGGKPAWQAPRCNLRTAWARASTADARPPLSCSPARATPTPRLSRVGASAWGICVGPQGWCVAAAVAPTPWTHRNTPRPGRGRFDGTAGRAFDCGGGARGEERVYTRTCTTARSTKPHAPHEKLCCPCPVPVGTWTRSPSTSPSS